MDLPFTGFELTFIIIAFLVFSLFGLASVCIEPRHSHPEDNKLSKNHLKYLKFKH
uniref:Uncharacterized protein n=1 Tax=Oryzias melastigma TaxID=30732 RepID=A0A3B3CYZ8_ORYME